MSDHLTVCTAACMPSVYVAHDCASLFHEPFNTEGEACSIFCAHHHLWPVAAAVLRVVYLMTCCRAASLNPLASLYNLHFTSVQDADNMHVMLCRQGMASLGPADILWIVSKTAEGRSQSSASSCLSYSSSSCSYKLSVPYQPCLRWQDALSHIALTMQGLCLSGFVQGINIAQGCMCNH